MSRLCIHVSTLAHTHSSIPHGLSALWYIISVTFAFIWHFVRNDATEYRLRDRVTIKSQHAHFAAHVSIGHQLHGDGDDLRGPVTTDLYCYC